MSFFRKGKGTGNFFFTKASGAAGEPGIREEVSRIIQDETRGSLIVYRRTRRDDQGNPILSNAAKGNRSSEALFKNNEGERFLFDDHLIRGYIALDLVYHEPGKVKQYGDSRTDNKCVFLEADILAKLYDDSFEMPDALDKIFIPKYDIEGKLASPLAIRETYDIGSVEPYRLDGTGRVEFFKVNVMTKFDKSNRL